MSVCEYIFVCNDNTITVPPLSPCTSIDMTHAMDIFSSMNLPLFSQFTSQKSHLSATKIRWKKNNKHTMYIVHCTFSVVVFGFILIKLFRQIYSWKKGTSLHFEWCEKCKANNEIFKCVLFNNVNGFYCLIAQSLRLLSSIFKYAKWSWCKRACTCSWAHSHVRIHPIICSKLNFLERIVFTQTHSLHH